MAPDSYFPLSSKMDDRRSIPIAKYAWHFATLFALLSLSWLMMMAVHELGHVVAAWGTGGTVTHVVLHPLAFSRTDVWPNPSPVLVVWAGPVIGVLLPILLWLLVKFTVTSAAWLFQFAVTFSLLANGIYIGVGWTQRIGDAGDMLRLGSERWQLVVFGVLCVVAALFCGRGLADKLRPRIAARDASARLAISLITLLALTVTAMAWLSPTS